MEASDPSVQLGLPLALRSSLLKASKKNMKVSYYYTTAVDQDGGVGIPQVILLDAANSPHASDFAPKTDELAADVRTRLDDDILVIRELWRRRVGIPLDVARYQLT